MTRTSSSAAAWWWGANITPIDDITTSNDPSANGRCSASASAHSSSRPSASARRRPASSSSGVRSLAVTLRAARGGRERGVAGARGDVEHPRALGDAARVDEPRPERQQERLHHVGVVARGPHRAVARLELRVCDVDRHLRSFHRFRMRGEDPRPRRPAHREISLLDCPTAHPPQRSSSAQVLVRDDRERHRVARPRAVARAVDGHDGPGVGARLRVLARRRGARWRQGENLPFR